MGHYFSPCNCLDYIDRCSESQPTVCKPKKTKKKFHLKYWNGRGLMEVPRTMLALKGVDYVDGRYTTDAPYDGVKDVKEIADSLGLRPYSNSPPFA